MLCVMAFTVSCFSMNIFASTDVSEIEAKGEQDVGIQAISTEVNGNVPEQEFFDLENLPQGEHLDSTLSGVPSNALNSREIWAIQDPVFVGNGTLTDSYDIYVVTLTAKQLAFLKLESVNPNLMAILYYVKDGVLDEPSNWGVVANSGSSYANIPEGQYAIVIGSSTGKEVGDYTLMWNCANPSGASSIINCTDNLARVVLYYDDSTILSNGKNVLKGLTWEEDETWQMPLGYTGRSMSITLADKDGGRGVYLGSFSSSAPYSAPNALLIEVNRGAWLYMNSYFRNDNGDVTHIMDWYDPSGLKTPRTFGEGEMDFSYGPSYIVVNLDTFEVCEFLSAFNYHYTKEGGRTFSLTNLRRL